MNPNSAYGRSRAQVTSIRLASWRQVVAAVACAACGAPAGESCRLGHDGDCARCGRLSACATGTRVHRVRFDAWLRPEGRR
jgi:hypothetical protein